MPVEFHIEDTSTEPTNCPYCQAEIQAADTLVRCTKCSATYHVSCWNEGDQCAMYGCGSELAVAFNQNAGNPKQNGTGSNSAGPNSTGSSSTEPNSATHSNIPQANFAGVPDFSIDISELASAPQFSISETDLAPALNCSYCHLEIGVGESSVVCMKCHATHHHDCWRERNRCAVYGCNHRVCSVPVHTNGDTMVYQPSTSMRNPTNVNVDVKTTWYQRAFNLLVDLFSSNQPYDRY